MHEKMVSSKLKTVGVDNHRAVHSCFVSDTNGDLNLTLDMLDDKNTREVIPRAFNRMVLIAPKLPFQVVTPGQYANKPFSMKTALLLVIVLQK